MQRKTGIVTVSLGAMALLACGGSTLTGGSSSGASTGGASSGVSTGGASSGVSTPDSGVHTGTTGASAGAGFPLGTFGMCTLADEPNTLGGALGGVTLSSENGVIVARFADGGAPATLDFSPTSPTSASLAPSGQTWVGPWAWCGGGVTDSGAIADPVPSEGTLDIASGTATFNGGTLFLTVEGNVEPSDGGGCATGPLSASVACAAVDVSGHTAGPPADGGSPRFAASAYSCSSDLQVFHSAAGGLGTLTLTQTGDVVTATYAGDYAAAGSLELVVTSDGSASPSPGQTFHTLSCAIPSNDALDTDDVTAGSLTLDGDTLFLDLIGAPEGDPACEGTSARLTLVCAKGDAG